MVIKATDPPFQPSAMKRVKLDLDPSRVYPLHRFSTPYGSEFKLLLDERGGGTTAVYMATLDGGPRVL
ncbi:hypothetical protein ABZZ20_11835 [Streptomyces sp. NPDC006430]|uniref:hypothetical protein n=1 Tax=Streptomyces sp. NPDC006430 TaxID=3154299 RepID=UPI0033A892BE